LQAHYSSLGPARGLAKDMCQITDDDNELNEDDEFDWSLKVALSLKFFFHNPEI
jgi:hypothetical protein